MRKYIVEFLKLVQEEDFGYVLRVLRGRRQPFVNFGVRLCTIKKRLGPYHEEEEI